MGFYARPVGGVQGIPDLQVRKIRHVEVVLLQQVFIFLLGQFVWIGARNWWTLRASTTISRRICRGADQKDICLWRHFCLQTCINFNESRMTIQKNTLCAQVLFHVIGTKPYAAEASKVHDILRSERSINRVFWPQERLGTHWSLSTLSWRRC